MKALSIRQPWAWLILHAGKDIENRGWTTPHRGPFLIHASKGMTRFEYECGCDLALKIKPQLKIPAFDELPRGGIVGIAHLVDCVATSDSPWFCGDYGFVLANAKPLPLKPVRGQLGFFSVDLTE